MVLQLVRETVTGRPDNLHDTPTTQSEGYALWVTTVRLRRSPEQQELAWILQNCIEDENGCMIWQGYVHPVTGYAYSGRNTLAHRRVVELVQGPIPALLQVDHVWERGCRSRACCAFDHLEVVTLAENARRNSYNRIKTGCPREAEHGPYDRETSGKRYCSKCASDAQKRFRTRR